MAVRVLIERKMKPAHRREVLALLRELRAGCLNQPGYISGETLFANEDPNVLVVLSTWFGLMDWRRWHSSAEREQIEAKLRPLLEAPESVRVLLEGITEEHSGA
jgi:quinol monooxygenase YgiN